MPENQEPTLLSLSYGHRAQSIRVVIEIGIACIVGLITYNARQITDDVERVVERLRLVEIAIEGNRSRVSALEKLVDNTVRINELQWQSIQTMRERLPR